MRLTHCKSSQMQHIMQNEHSGQIKQKGAV
uniref:Uncharacterized protein n=1 Tax=Siphoviridae sp. ctQqU1 TaxID=2825496 RepID=A0A8S5Q5A0_9CAUD|nr:MAG TPA: hypothetical protein [Siphoviridae sp. ctQqU1]